MRSDPVPPNIYNIKFRFNWQDTQDFKRLLFVRNTNILPCNFNFTEPQLLPKSELLKNNWFNSDSCRRYSFTVFQLGLSVTTHRWCYPKIPSEFNLLWPVLFWSVCTFTEIEEKPKTAYTSAELNSREARAAETTLRYLLSRFRLGFRRRCLRVLPRRRLCLCWQEHFPSFVFMSLADASKNLKKNMSKKS